MHCEQLQLSGKNKKFKKKQRGLLKTKQPTWQVLEEQTGNPVPHREEVYGKLNHTNTRTKEVNITNHPKKNIIPSHTPINYKEIPNTWS